MDRETKGQYSGYFGIALNILLFVLKLVYAGISGSVSLKADAFNNLMDILSSLVVVLGFSVSKLKADEDHPFGHGRMEHISGLIISVIIVFTGIELGKSSIMHILSPELINSSPAIYVILVLSIVFKLSIALYNYILGKKINSLSLVINAKDSAGDVLTSLLVLLSLLLGDIFKLQLDGYAGLIVSLLILYAGLSSMHSSISPLLGESLSLEKRREIKKYIENNSFFMNVHDIVLHSYGYNSNVLTLHVEVDADNSLMSVHEQVDNLELNIKKAYGYNTLIHVDPILMLNKNLDSAFIQRQELIEELLASIDPKLSYHDFRMFFQNGREYIRFDVYAPFSIKKSNKELKHNIIMLLMQRLDKSTKYIVDIVRCDL